MNRYVKNVPPSDIDAEGALIGAMLRHPGKAAYESALTPDSFHNPVMGRVLRAIVEIEADGTPADLVAVAQHIAATGEFDLVGGVDGLQSIIANQAGNITHADYYSRIIIDKFGQRQLLHLMNQLSDQIQNPSGPQKTPELIGKLHDGLNDVLQGGSSGSAKPIVDVMLANDQSKPRDTIATGLHDLDAALGGGLSGGQLIVIAARTSQGKSALAATVAANVATAGHATMFASIEMQNAEVADRLRAIQSGVSLADIRERQTTEADADAVARAESVIADWPMFLADNLFGVNEISAEARRLSKRHDLKLLVVDYLQIVRPDDSRMPREQQVASISRSLKQLAKNLSIPIIALAQLNRSADQRDGRPRLSDLRESGAIEQDADSVIFIHRTPEKSELVVAKNRNGPVGIVDITWIPTTTAFKSAAAKYSDTGF